MQSGKQIRSNQICRSVRRFRFCIRMIEADAQIQRQSVHTPGVATIDTVAVDVILRIHQLAQFSNARTCADITASRTSKEIVVVQDDVAAVLRG